MEKNLSDAIGDINLIQLGIWIAIYHPDHINCDNEYISIVVPTPAEFEAVESKQKIDTNVLSMFQLKPPGMKGDKFLNHMVGIRKQR